MDTSSEAYKLACIRAADMAIYDYSSSTSPMYGTLNDMCNLWKISSSHPSENIWKAPSKQLMRFIVVSSQMTAAGK